MCKTDVHRYCEKFSNIFPFPVEEQNCHFEPKKICELEMKVRPKKVEEYSYTKDSKEQSSEPVSAMQECLTFKCVPKEQNKSNYTEMSKVDAALHCSVTTVIGTTNQEKVTREGFVMNMNHNPTSELSDVDGSDIMQIVDHVLPFKVVYYYFKEKGRGTQFSQDKKQFNYILFCKNTCKLIHARHMLIAINILSRASKELNGRSLEFSGSMSLENCGDVEVNPGPTRYLFIFHAPMSNISINCIQ